MISVILITLLGAAALAFVIRFWAYIGALIVVWVFLYVCYSVGLGFYTSVLILMEKLL